MRFQFVQPSGILSKYIKHYWILESDAFEGNVCERVIPTGNVQLMFHYKNPFVVFDQNNTTFSQPQSIISGLSSSYFDVSTRGESGVIAVSFFPTGACHFFGFPLMEVEGMSLHLADIYNLEIKNIEEKICNASSLSERIAIIESFLMKKYTPVPHHDYSMIQASVSLIKKQRGQINVIEMAEKLSVTTKSLERKFSALVGKTPKQFIKLVRFQEVLLDLSKLKNASLTEYAYNNGFFDQSHFIKDFKLYSGYTPGEFLSKCPCDYLESDFRM